jgi:hypothetical protein
MSSASSISSSLPDSHAGSYSSPSHLQDPTASGISLAGASEDGGDHDRDPSASTEPMFNFRSLAEVVGVSLEGENAGRRISRIEAEKAAKQAAENNTPATHSEAKHEEAHEGAEVEVIEDVSKDIDRPAEPTISLTPPTNKDGVSSYLTPPEVTITPETPAPEDGDESKQLGYNTPMEHPHEVTQ